MLLSHSDVLGVALPVIAENVELALEYEGDGEVDGVGGGQVVVLGSEDALAWRRSLNLRLISGMVGDRSNVL